MKLCIKANADDRAKGVMITGNNNIIVSLYVQDGNDKGNFVGEIELIYRNDVEEFGDDPNEEYKPDMNEWTVSFRPRVDEYTDPEMIAQGHVYPSINKTASRKRGK
jgi:hypothetical protein